MKSLTAEGTRVQGLEIKHRKMCCAQFGSKHPDPAGTSKINTPGHIRWPLHSLSCKTIGGTPEDSPSPHTAALTLPPRLRSSCTRHSHVPALSPVHGRCVAAEGPPGVPGTVQKNHQSTKSVAARVTEDCRHFKQREVDPVVSSSVNYGCLQAHCFGRGTNFC